MGQFVFLVALVASLTIAGDLVSGQGPLTRSQSTPDVRTGSVAPSCSRNNQFDYLVLAIQWPLSFCYEKQECNLQIAKKRQWSIHGLWPNRRPLQRSKSFQRRKRQQQQQRQQKSTDQGRYPPNVEFCCGPPYNSSMITRRVHQELQEYWPTLHQNSRHHSFWRHEWQKHGTCASRLAKLKNQNAYFESILKLYKKYNLNSLPLRSNQTYPLSRFHQLIEPVVGKKIRVECSLADPISTGVSTRARAKSKVSIFSEIHICLDNNLSPIDCFRRDDYECKNPILFP